MRKNGKRLASFLLALVMMISLLPTEVIASGLEEPIEETPAPITDVVVEPTPEPTDGTEPTVEPTAEPSVEPAVEPTEEPEVEPTEEPADEPETTGAEQPGLLQQAGEFFTDMGDFLLAALPYLAVLAVPAVAALLLSRRKKKH